MSDRTADGWSKASRNDARAEAYAVHVGVRDSQMRQQGQQVSHPVGRQVRLDAGAAAHSPQIRRYRPEVTAEDRQLPIEAPGRIGRAVDDQHGLAAAAFIPMNAAAVQLSGRHSLDLSS